MEYKELVRNSATILAYKRFDENYSLFGNLTEDRQEELKKAYIDYHGDMAAIAAKAERELIVYDRLPDFISSLVAQGKLTDEHIKLLKTECNKIIEYAITDDLVEHYRYEITFREYAA